MIFALTTLALGTFAALTEEAHYVDASLDLDGELLSWQFVDLDENGALELVVAVGLSGGERELRVHPLSTSGVRREAATTIRVLPDIVAWGAADVREEPGRELLLMTRGGVWSYSPTLPGYRDNVARLAEEELVYDMPDPRRLPFWEYVFDDAGADRILLPGRDRISIWGRAADEAAYSAVTTLPTTLVDSSTEALAPEGRSRGGGARISTREDSPFLPEGSAQSSTLVEDAYAYEAPALLDPNGDGRLDLVVLADEQLAFYFATESGIPSVPSRVEPLPDILTTEDGELDLQVRLVDANGDRYLDAVVRVADEPEGLENRLQRLLVFHGDAQRVLGAKPDQVLRFEAGDLDFRVVDVDADGRPDLLVEKLELPSMVGAVTGIEFTFERLLFLGESKGFSRRPSFSLEETFNEETAVELAASRRWTHDCNGDGTADLVEVDLQGRITVRRLRKTGGGLRGGRWSLDASPWKQFEVEGSIDSLVVEDVNADGLGDIVSAGDGRLTVLLSVRKGGGR